MENFRRFYKRFPKEVCADAGYGCLKNYRFCDENNIEAYIKVNVLGVRVLRETSCRI